MLQIVNSVHCKSYVCLLDGGCVCRCNSCKLVKGTCPHCGRSDSWQFTQLIQPIQPLVSAIPATPWIYQQNTWYCGACNTYHTLGYQCNNPGYGQSIPFIGGVSTNSSGHQV